MVFRVDSRGRRASLTEGLAAREVGFGGRGAAGRAKIARASELAGCFAGNLATLLRTQRRGRGRERLESRERGGGRGLRRQLGVQPHRVGSDGRDVVGGGCTPLLVRAPATNDHPWSIHGGFTRQVRPTPRVVVVAVRSSCASTFFVHLSRRPRSRYLILQPPMFVCFRRDPPGSGACRARDARRGGFELGTRPWCEGEGRVRLARETAARCEIVRIRGRVLYRTGETIGKTALAARQC